MNVKKISATTTKTMALIVTLTTITTFVSTVSFAPTASAQRFDFFDNIRESFQGKYSEKQREGIADSKQKATQEIDRRLAALGSLKGLVSSSTTLTSGQQSALIMQIDELIAKLNAHKTEVASSDSSRDIRSVTHRLSNDYRAYAFMTPKIHLLKVADSVIIANSRLAMLAEKLETRIAAEANSGNDVAALNAQLADMKERITNALGIATAAKTSLIEKQSNDRKATIGFLRSYHAKLKEARSYNHAALSTAKSIVSALKGM